MELQRKQNGRSSLQKLSIHRAIFKKTRLFGILKEKADDFDKQNKIRAKRIFYFSIAPRFIEVIADGLYKHRVCNRVALDRIVIEKPFGTDLHTARELNVFLSKRYSEKQVYRIDHYLGKETVQNIMAFRFANYVFEPLWNKKYIDHVQISVGEQVGVGNRGGYYDSSGALRDMIQNHLLQLLCNIAMDAPSAYQAELIRDAKTEVLKKIRLYSGKEVFKNVVRGQYTEGMINDKKVNAYREEKQVAPDSTTETFVSARFFVDNKRWEGVPFF